MKQLIKLGMLSQLLLSTPLFALNPVEGFYGGLFGEMSHGPSNDTVIFREDAQLFQGTVGYSPISGGGGLMLGYKFRHFRGEAEIMFNRISTGPVKIGTCTIENQDIVTPTGFCPAGTYDHIQEKALGYSGNSTAVYGFFNGFWDFFTFDGVTDTVPYLGLGIGYADIKNGNSYTNTITEASHGKSIASNGAAMQGILGISYYLDDYAWIAADYRYVTAKRKEYINTLDLATNLPAKNYTINALTISVNVAFDKGAIEG